MSATTRIGVLNLDAVEQTRLWLALGPEEATRTLLAVIRTALLMCETVVVDRNQVLEGIFFISVDPDRLGWHLGLEPGAPLPLTVGLLNPGDDPDESATPGPWSAGQTRHWGVSPDLVEQIDLNFHAVVRDRQRVSSPAIALTGRYGRSIVSEGGSVNALPASEAWLRTDGVTLPQHLWDMRDDEVAAAVIDRGRRSWLEAMKSGRTAVEPWRPRPLAIGEAFVRSLPPRPRTRELLEQLLALEEVDGLTQACTAYHAVLGDGPCGRHHATKRSLVVRWLDGEDVPELRPRRLDPTIREAAGAAQLSCAFRWWNVAYYDAICERDELRTLTLYNAEEADPVVVAVESEWGLRKPARSSLALGLARISRVRPTAGRDVAVEGSILDQLRTLSPQHYAQLAQHSIIDKERLWTSPSNRAMFDLALAVDDMATGYTPRSVRLRSQLIRFAVLTVLAVVLVLQDQGKLPERSWWVAVWLILALAAAFPWSDLLTLFRLSGGRLQSVLRIRDSP